MEQVTKNERMCQKWFAKFHSADFLMNNKGESDLKKILLENNHSILYEVENRKKFV